jgi:hypothetical protein
MARVWSDTVQSIQKLQQEAKANGYPLWFRGQRAANWVLLSSIHRNINASFERVLGVPSQSVSEAEKIELMRETFKTLFHKFKARAVQLLPEHEKSDWGLVFAMQHLGLPTRLLDWTESFPCALYFAQHKRNPSDDAAIFIFSPQQHNQTVVGREGLVFLGGDASKPMIVKTHQYHPAVVRGADDNDMETLAVEPELTNPRMVAQRSAFTLCGASFQPLEERYPDSIRKFVIRSEDFPDAQAFLDLASQTHFGYFPDLDGLKVQLIEGLEQEILLARDYRAKHETEYS